MRKGILYITLVFLSISSCEKIDDERFQPFIAQEEGKIMNDWGFIANFHDASFSITNANQTGYTITLLDTATAVLEENIINSAGFIIRKNADYNNDNIIPAQMTRIEDVIVFEATIPGCLFDTNYTITPYVGSGDKSYKGRDISIRRSKEDIIPKLDQMYYFLEMSSNAHTITAIIQTKELIDDFTFSFAGTTKKATKVNDRFSADFDLNELEGGKKYSGIILEASNSLGNVRGKIPYEVIVRNYDSNSRFCIQNESDGPHDDYITIGGINWAKGNLICENGLWRIDKDPLATPLYTQNSSFVQFFSFGNTSGLIDLFPTNEQVAKMPETISGDSRYDIVTANIGKGWRLPSYEESCILAYSTSQQITNKGIILYPIKTRDRLFFSSTPVTLKDIPEDGLFLPASGLITQFYNGSQFNYSTIGAYMTGTKVSGINDNLWTISFWLNNPYGIPIFFVSNLEDSARNGGFYGYWRATSMKYKIRPVYSSKEFTSH